jgi:hypothetical protein
MQEQIWRRANLGFANPSGLNAHYHPPQLARLFGEFREFVEKESESCS